MMENQALMSPVRQAQGDKSVLLQEVQLIKIINGIIFAYIIICHHLEYTTSTKTPL